MIALGVVSALLLALLPIVVVQAWRSSKTRALWEIALDVPFAVALDLLLTCLIARFMLLELAVWTSRALWLSAGLVWLLGRRSLPKLRDREWAWPKELNLHVAAGALLLGAVAVGFSLTISRPCAIWDRQFHIPFVTSLRGEMLPFASVYEPDKELFYHYAGHVYAAALQALSFSILHSSHALSLAHDFYFFWIGVCTALLLRHMGLRNWTLAIVVLVGMLLSGPVTLLWGELGRPGSGYSLTNYLTLSFRPHVSLSTLMMLSFLIVPLARLARVSEPASARSMAGPLAACSAVLMIADEFSVGLLGLALGCLWLYEPRVLGRSRREGFALLIGLLAAMGGSALLLKGTLGPGAPHYGAQFDPPHVPGFYAPQLPFSDPAARIYFLGDLFGILTLLVLGVVLVVKARSRAALGIYIFYAVLAWGSIALFSTVVYKNSGLQNHRFVTAAMFSAPLFVAAWLLTRDKQRNLMKADSLPVVLMFGALGLGAACTLEWLVGGIAKVQCRDLKGFPGDDLFYSTNCRSRTGATVVTEPTQSFYGDPSIWYLYSGCRPVFAPGPFVSMDGHTLKVGAPRLGRDALLELHQNPSFLNGAERLKAVCAINRDDDAICREIRGTVECRQEGKAVEACDLDARQRGRVLGIDGHPPAGTTSPAQRN